MQPWVIANWKMNGSLAHVAAYVPALLDGLPKAVDHSRLSVALCPPLPYLTAVHDRLSGSSVQLGAQQVLPVASGAYTGEVSAAMLRDCGATLCLVGHSERRQFFGETNVSIAQKLHALLEADMAPVLCIGETLDEREHGHQQEVIRMQLREAFQPAGEKTGHRRGDVQYLEHPALSADQARRLIVAYEPVWAIGTGVTATPEQAGEMHAFIRAELADAFGAKISQEIPLLYGGSVNADNAASLMEQPEINGALVGGASLKPETFLPIIEQSQT